MLSMNASQTLVYWIDYTKPPTSYSFLFLYNNYNYTR